MSQLDFDNKNSDFEGGPNLIKSVRSFSFIRVKDGDHRTYPNHKRSEKAQLSAPSAQLFQCSVFVSRVGLVSRSLPRGE